MRLRRIATMLAGVTLAFSGVAVAAAPASAAIVPNRFYCAPSGGWCYQVNGAYVPGLPIVCHWKRSGMAGKPHQMYYTACPSWGPDVP